MQIDPQGWNMKEQILFRKALQLFLQDPEQLLSSFHSQLLSLAPDSKEMHTRKTPLLGCQLFHWEKAPVFSTASCFAGNANLQAIKLYRQLISTDQAAAKG